MDISELRNDHGVGSFATIIQAILRGLSKEGLKALLKSMGEKSGTVRNSRGMMVGGVWVTAVVMVAVLGKVLWDGREHF